MLENGKLQLLNCSNQCGVLIEIPAVCCILKQSKYKYIYMYKFVNRYIFGFLI